MKSKKKVGNKGGGRGSRMKNRIVDLQEELVQDDSGQSARERRKIAALWKRIQQQDDVKSEDNDYINDKPSPKAVEESDEYMESAGSLSVSVSSGEASDEVITIPKKRGRKKRKPKVKKKIVVKVSKSNKRVLRKRKKKKVPKLPKKKKVGRKRKRSHSSSEVVEIKKDATKFEDDLDDEELSEPEKIETLKSKKYFDKKSFVNKGGRQPPKKRRKLNNGKKRKNKVNGRNIIRDGEDDLLSDEFDNIKKEENEFEVLPRKLPRIPKKKSHVTHKKYSQPKPGSLKERMERERIFRMDRETLFHHFVSSLTSLE